MARKKSFSKEQWEAMTGTEITTILCLEVAFLYLRHDLPEKKKAL